MKKALLASLVLLLTSAAWSQDGTMMKSDKPKDDGMMMKSDKPAGDAMMMKGDAPAGDAMMMKPDAMMTDPMDKSAYNLKGLGKQVVPFTSEMDAQALAKKGTVVYYFAATWCPDCQATYKDLKANFSKIPMNMTLVVVNYDKAADLKKKYGITMQHTFVVLGAMGEKKKVWAGAATVADIVKNAASM